jgi:thiamine biosynthesis lipoprotein
MPDVMTKLRTLRSLIGVMAGLAATACAPPTPALQTVSGIAQGTTYAVQWWGDSSVDAAAVAVAIERELDRIDQLLSNYREDSVIERFNAAQTVAPLEVPAEFVDLLRLAADVHRRTDGCFDPTVRPLVRLWGFDGDQPRVPAADAIAATLEHVGFDKIELLDAQHVRKTVPALELDMASIGQGYTAARLADVVEQFGIHDYLAEIGGEISARGTKPAGEPWRVGVENPTADGASLALRLPADRRTGVVTSGTYRHYFEDTSRTYSHILDPTTGQPVEHATLAVTVLAPDATLAGAWATALLCIGPDRAAVTVDREGIAALWWVRAGATVELRRSSSFTAAWASAIE